MTTIDLANLHHADPHGTLFTDLERNLIAAIDDFTCEDAPTDVISSPMLAVYLYALSLSETRILTAYFDPSVFLGRNIDDPNGAAMGWWLRSYSFGDKVYAVDSDGRTGTLNRYAFLKTRPAMDIDTSTILLISAATDGKSAPGMEGALTAVPATAVPSTWKLTITDDNRAFSAVTTAYDAANKRVTIAYTGAVPKTSDAPNEYISAVIKNADGSVGYYGRLAQPVASSGTLTFALPPSVDMTGKTLMVFSEQYNGGNASDYASALSTIPLERNACAVFYSLTNIASSNAAGYHLIANAYETTFTVASPYLLPQAITVAVDGTPLGATDYTYSATSGALSVPAAKITGDLTITASGALPPSANPTASVTTVAKTAATQKSVTFSLTNDPAYPDGQRWTVYAGGTGATLAAGVTAANAGNTLTLSGTGDDIGAGEYWVSVTELDKSESARLKLTVVAYAPPSVTLGVDKTVTVTFDYNDAETVTKEDAIAITTSAGTGGSVTFAARDFSLSSSGVKNDGTTAVSGASITAIGQAGAGNTTLTIRITKSRKTSIMGAYLWYGGGGAPVPVGQITIIKIVNWSSTDAALTALSYRVGGGAAVPLNAGQLATAATSSGLDVALPYGTSATAAIELLGDKSNANATISGGTGQLVGGSKSITLTVTAQDSITMQNYTLNFTTQGKTPAPAFMSTGDALTAPDDVTATFTLTNAVAGGTYRVYAASTGGSALPNLLTVSGNTVTLTLPASPASETKYHISVQPGSDLESDRTEVTIYPYTASVIAFTTQPQDATVIFGRVSGSLTAAVSVSTSAAATLSWYACDAGGAISGAPLYTGGTFAIPTNLTLGDHYYLCRAACSGVTKDSRAAKVSVVGTAPLGIGISPASTILQGAADETIVTVGSGVSGFDINNFDRIKGVQMRFENEPFITLTQGTECDVVTGSIKVTLHKAYLDTLAAGRYTLRVNLTGAGYPPYVETTLTVMNNAAAPQTGGNAAPPQTGDNAAPGLWLLLCLLGGAGLFMAIKKQRRA